MATETTPKLSPQRLAEAIKREPLIGLTAAAKLLGIAPSNFRRDALPHLNALAVEGSANVYFRSEVLALKRQWSREPQKRDGRRLSPAKRAENGSAPVAA